MQVRQERHAPAGELVPPGYFTVGVQMSCNLPGNSGTRCVWASEWLRCRQSALPGEIAADNVLLRPLVKGVLQNR